MSFALSAAARSLLIFAQVAAEMLALGLARRLGFGRFGAAVFLPRGQHRALSRELADLEALTRRTLYMIAANAGPLPPTEQPAARAPRPVPAATRPESHAPRAARLPKFRLTEPQPRQPANTPPAPTPLARREDPIRATDLIPAARLVRRFRALTGVFEAPEHHILRMRHLISAAPCAVLNLPAPQRPPARTKPGTAAHLARLLEAPCAHLERLVLSEAEARAGTSDGPEPPILRLRSG
ncbi:hypothetical protein [Hyphomonas sp.]|uniref:hypothetical protein n=1 Tax=Hyphomonas sp. TaxID=87 RepID=UPI003919A4E3